MAKLTNWLTAKSRYWTKNSPVWIDSMKVYESNIRELRNDRYLIQRYSGESKNQFDERRRLADFNPVFSIIADTYVGRMLEAENRINRVWTEGDSVGLGDHTDQNTLAGKLWKSADGGSTSWLTMIEDGIVQLAVMSEVWVYVQGVKRNQQGQVISRPCVRLIEPWAVHDALWSGDNCIEAKVYHEMDTRDSLKKEQKFTKRYTLYTIDGYEEWEVSEKDGEEHKQITKQLTPYGDIEGEPFHFYADKDRTEKTLPIFRVKLSLRRNPGAILADKNLVIFNQESERDNILRVGNTPKAQYVGDWSRFQKFIKENNAGRNIWNLEPGASKEHKFIAPSMDPAKIATEVLDKKVEQMFLAGFQYYESSIRGKVKPVAQVQQESSGENSYLNVLATGADAIENGAGFRLEQIQNPGKPEQWGTFSAQRKKDFTPLDEREETDKAMKRYFGTGGTVVMTREAEFQLTKKAYEQDGIAEDDENIYAEIDAKRTDTVLQRETKRIENDRARTLAFADATSIQERVNSIERAARG